VLLNVTGDARAFPTVTEKLNIKKYYFDFFMITLCSSKLLN
jgi:hypothetical protein